MTNGGMFVEERKQRILERIERRRKATVAVLCEQFHVSSATSRPRGSSSAPTAGPW